MNSITSSSPTAAQYRAAAATSLHQAIAFREAARRRCALFDRRIDRQIMRAFALEWRGHIARATLGGDAA